MDEVKFTIDGKEVSGSPGETILEVGLRHGIEIPSLCYHPWLSKTGACRICLVRVNGGPLKTSCTEPGAAGMKVETEDAEIVNIRKGILELLLAEGDHNCLFCDGNGECEFQALVKRYGLEESSSGYPRSRREVDYESSEGLRRNENRCVLCGRCVKACSEIQVSNVWSFAGRGSGTHLTADVFAPVGASSCRTCGMCVQLCPTGALSFQTVLGKGQAWKSKRSRVSVSIAAWGER